MSEKSVSPDFVTQNQPRKVKKFHHKNSKNKNRKTSKRETSNEQPVLVDDEKGKEEENKKEIKGQRAKVPKQKDTFPRHIPEKEIDKLLRNENSNETQYIEGQLRVNPWRPRINQPEKWKMHQGYEQKTGVIVCIREKIHPRKTIGYFKQNGEIFYPRDRRVPLVKISKKSLQQFGVCQNYKDILYLVVITDWTKPKFAVGQIEKIIGSIGDIKAESNSILLEYDLDVTPYSLDVTKELPSSDYSLTENDIKDREDWKDECIFTIDPDTAVDLDDSVSCKPLENGNYEIGVHISDVTHYVEFLSPLDIQVSKRATTIYMADNVYHMLPKELCQLCSLSPGQDKLAFSVIWEMTQDAKVVKHRFAKTVIRSCCQMSYQHVQKMIENPEYNWPDDSIYIDGNYKLSDLSIKVNILHNLAVQMRKRRFQNGALQINQPKLYVSVDRITGLPVSYNIEEQQDSNRLIEEFMLLANMTVATHLYNVIPETALLRNHREPSKHILSTTQDMLQKFGIHLDIESSTSLHTSMKRCEEGLETEDDERRIIMKYRMMVINSLCSRAMARATYICSSTVKAEEELRHYALNISLYTHFTSPIRRYSDCVVHRLLYSTLRNVDMPKEWSKKLCKSIAANCNIKKYSAKMAQERSNELYFTYLIDLKGPIVTMGIVSSVHESFITIILCHLGIKLRVSFTHLENLALIEYSSECSLPTINISWKQSAITQVINVFTLLHLRVEKHPESFQLIGILLPPTEETKI
ncbi:DIS3-like exonuclease 2 isoform X2 [Bombus pyrosoma]|uniref:DIS3-like exonuclease 2 isoform X2 n=1 Tax=Bombus pyrosoma TaxID=396416 RepID=UPI001CB967EF|nr:DIS3-like exonuclease 2 isoform X2 [Bombus pyrosoma]